MMFEEILRDKLIVANKTDKAILKVVLGEFQQKNSLDKATDQDGYNIVEKIISANNETSGYFKPEDPRLIVLQQENNVLAGLLPVYMLLEDLLTKLEFLKSVIVVANSDGSAMRIAIKWCKDQKIDVKGDTVKQAVTLFRAGSN